MFLRSDIEDDFLSRTLESSSEAEVLLGGCCSSSLMPFIVLPAFLGGKIVFHIWLFGCVVVWLCGYVVVWLCGCVVVWLCGYVVVWLCGCVVVWLCGCVVVWLCGCVVVWLCGCVVVWLCGCVAVWLPHNHVGKIKTFCRYRRVNK